MFFRKKNKPKPFDRNLSTSEANKLKAEAEAEAKLSPEAVLYLEFLYHTEKLQIAVNMLGADEVERRMSEPKVKVIALVLGWLMPVIEQKITLDAEKADVAKRIWEELMKHMTPSEYERFDDLYISVMDNGELLSQKLFSAVEVQT